MLPNLIIIGAAKAGTTSLHAYLGQHPSVFMADVKEARYFYREDWRERRGWYEAQFDSDLPVRGEATPGYTFYPVRRHVPERMHELIPEAKLIYLVRDPIERIVSHWVQRRADGDPVPFERYMRRLEDPDNELVCASRYWTQLERYLKYFGAASLMVVDQHELRTEGRATLRSIFRFLGVDDTFDGVDLTEERNTREQKYGPRRGAIRLWNSVVAPVGHALPPRAQPLVFKPATKLLLAPVTETPAVADAVRRRLEELLSPEVEALRRFSGQRFESWSL